MTKVNIHEAKTNFSKLINRAINGEEVIIAKAGKPVVKLVPIENKVKKRKLGTAIGQLKVSNDFNQPLPDEIMEGFYH